MGETVKTKHRKLLNTRQASEYLGGVPAMRTLQDWRRDGKGPVVTWIEGNPYYDPNDLDAYREKSKEHPSERSA